MPQKIRVSSRRLRRTHRRLRRNSHSGMKVRRKEHFNIKTVGKTIATPFNKIGDLAKKLNPLNMLKNLTAKFGQMAVIVTGVLLVGFICCCCMFLLK